MPNKSPRIFSREFKLEAVRRILAGERIKALSQELKVLRKDLYAWRDLFRAGGAEALRPLGRPRKDAVVAAGVRERARDAAEWRPVLATAILTTKAHAPPLNELNAILFVHLHCGRALS
jgi:transposase-like protein